ncbi:uncharacterized protein LOC110710620 [Chenopodium quinoa]|uniref:uncharacterized protein LOC110710620 n=1 Tax=Chenopodium quinoa TaxID=63459 RepID=UPI000B7805B4|nr:uncharacterized protein LOC110710620 [Chenopodium quinoa]
MKTLCWNCNGLGNPLTVKALRDWCWRDRPNAVFVMETKIDAQRLELIRNSCGFATGLCLSSNRRSGGLGLWWRDLNVEVVSYSAHHIEANVCDASGVPSWKMVGVYGWPEATQKYRTWDLMRNIHAGCSIPMLYFGDFNEILGVHEKSGGVTRGERQMDGFRNALEDCGLRDLVYKGSIYTWERGISIDTLVRERLDRYAASNGWCSMFPYAEVINFPICQSDHAAILLKFGEKDECDRKGKIFRFEALWLSNDECSKVVSDAWQGGLSEPMHTTIARVAEDLSN